MADEETAIAPIEQAPEPAIVEAEQVEESVNLEAPQEAEEKTTTELTEEELEEFEWNGRPIKGPKGLKDGVLMQADYTKKTQEVSARQKALDAREAQVEERQKVSEEEIDARADLRTVTKQLEAYSALTPEDWRTHQRADPMGTQEALMQFQFLKDQKAELEGKLGKATTARTEKAQQDYAKRLQETRDFANKEIKGWTPELASKVFEHAGSVGASAKVLEENMSPALITLLHQAYVGAQALKKATALPTPNPPTPKPLTIVGGKGGSANTTSLADADMDQYVALRRKGVGGKKLA
jgi:hypothetical protein